MMVDRGPAALARAAYHVVVEMRSWRVGRPLFSEPHGTGGTGAPAVVFLHGLTASGRSWRRIVAALDDAGLRLYLIDPLGFGRSPWPRVAYTTDDHLAALETWRTETVLASRPIILVGHFPGRPPGPRGCGAGPDGGRRGPDRFARLSRRGGRAPPVRPAVAAEPPDADGAPAWMGDLHGDVRHAAPLPPGGAPGFPTATRRRWRATASCTPGVRCPARWIAASSTRRSAACPRRSRRPCCSAMAMRPTLRRSTRSAPAPCACPGRAWQTSLERATICPVPSRRPDRPDPCVRPGWTGGPVDT